MRTTPAFKTIGIISRPRRSNLAEVVPELLDWLSSDFMAGDWRLKRLHKLIMTSSTYRLSATADGQRVLYRLLTAGDHTQIEAHDEVVHKTMKLANLLGTERSGQMVTALAPIQASPAQAAALTGCGVGIYA